MATCRGLLTSVVTERSGTVSSAHLVVDAATGMMRATRTDCSSIGVEAVGASDGPTRLRVSGFAGPW